MSKECDFLDFKNSDINTISQLITVIKTNDGIVVERKKWTGCEIGIVSHINYIYSRHWHWIFPTYYYTVQRST